MRKRREYLLGSRESKVALAYCLSHVPKDRLAYFAAMGGENLCPVQMLRRQPGVKDVSKLEACQSVRSLRTRLCS